MVVFNRIRISTAILSQLLALLFLLMSLSLLMAQSEFVSEQERSAHLFTFGLWLLYGFAAMLVSWLMTLSLARSDYRAQVNKLCCSGVTICVALLWLSCLN